MELYKIKEFFKRPGINKIGICKEAGVSRQYLHLVLSGEMPLSENFISKLLPVMREYGYKS